MSVAATASLFIGGSWTNGSGAELEVVDPATEETLTVLPTAAPADVDAAIAAARAAQPAWRALSTVERSRYVRRLADVLEERREPLAEMLVREVGKPVSRARGEVDWAVAYARYMAEWDRRIEGEIVPSDHRDEAIHLVRVPLGVVAAICPWNYPLGVLVRKLAPALVTGNTVVAKASEVTPLTTLEVARLLADEVELPRGVVNIVTGAGAVGAALVASPHVDMISMTGHRDTGKRIMAAAAQNLTRVSLELGGKAPAIVLRDARLDDAVAAIVAARHENSGQVCICAERVYVDDAVFDEFVERYVAAARELRVGSPWDDPDLGPLVSRPQLEKAQAAVEAAVGDGARLALDGRRLQGDAFSRGYWFGPTVVTEVDPSMAVMREETFAPVTPIMPVASLEEALALANASRYGLSAYLYTNDYRAVMRAANEIEAGELYVNRSLGEAFQAFHIGHGDSGLGGEDGKHGLLKYTQLRSVYHRYG